MAAGLGSKARLRHEDISRPLANSQVARNELLRGLTQAVASVHRRRASAWPALLISLCLTGSAFGQSRSWDNWVPPPRPPVEIIMHGTKLRIPRAYVSAAFLGADDPAVDLSVFANDFRPYNPETAGAGFPRSFLPEGVTIFASAIPRLSPAEAHLPRWFAILDDSWVEPATNWIESGDTNAGTADPPPGLRMRRAVPATDGRYPGVREDRFDPSPATRVADGTPEAIYCTSQASYGGDSAALRSLNFLCEQYVVFRGIRVKLRYNRRHLPSWLEFRGRTLALLESFVVDQGG